MTYPVIQLINEAFYTSSIVSRQFQTVSGDQFDTGFLKLNEILSDTTIEDDMIPYFTTNYSFNVVPSQEKYFIPNLTEAETLTFFLQSIRYQMRKNPRDQYFGSGRANNINSLPFNWHVERTFGGSNLFIYFFPDQNYPMTMTGLFSLQQVNVGQDLQNPLATANLGNVLVTGPGVLNVGNLVVNGVDLTGTYFNAAALVAHINTAVIPFVSAQILNGQLFLSNILGTIIRITTVGNQPIANGITFTNFSTTNGPLDQTFFPMVLDTYYINYLQYYLAERLCTTYNFEMPDGAKKQLLKYQQLISKRSSPIDFTMEKISTMTKKSSINYAQVNLGKGWSI